MARVRLRFAGWTTIERVVDSALMDPDSLEPIGDPEVEQQGLWSERVPQRHATPDFQPFDVDQQIRGHYAFLVEDLERAEFWPQVGDMVISHGRMTVRDQIINIDTEAHYRDGAQMCKAYYADKAPASDGNRSHGGNQWGM